MNDSTTLTAEEAADLQERHDGTWQSREGRWGNYTAMTCSCDLGAECSVPRLLAVIADQEAP